MIRFRRGFTRPLRAGVTLFLGVGTATGHENRKSQDEPQTGDVSFVGHPHKATKYELLLKIKFAHSAALQNEYLGTAGKSGVLNIIYHIGRYFKLLIRVFSRPEKIRIYLSRFLTEIDQIGIGSMGLIALMSVFIGAVIALQTASAIDSPLVPSYAVGFTTRQSIILEFSPTILSLILAGKIGSNIASEIGTMRVTEQIDALEIMGVNAAAFLMMPKILAGIFIFPFILMVSMGLGITGGWFICDFTGVVSSSDFIYGLQLDFKPFHVVYAVIKSIVFAFIITSVASYHGYYARGSAIEVGKSSTDAVVYSSVAILITNYILTQLLLF